MYFELEGHLADPEVAWRRLGDTDWMNRVGGNGRIVEQEMRADRVGWPRLVGTLAGPAGMRMPFEEVASDWVVGRRFRQERRLSGVGLARTLYEVELAPEGEGVRPWLRLEVDPSGPVMAPAARIQVSSVRRRWQRVLAELPAPGEAAGAATRRRLPAVVRERLERWRGRGASEALVERVREHLETARPVELQRMQPFVLADRWAMDREEVLQGLLEGVVEGVFELYWSVRCPTCHGQVQSSPTLEEVADHAGCPSCRLDFGVDLADTVEVCLAPHPTLRLRPEETFCTLFPAAATAVRASYVLPPGGVREERIPLDPGPWQLAAGSLRPPVHLVASADGASSWSWRASGHEREARVASGEPRLRLDNDTEGWVRAVVAPRGPLDDRVTGARLAFLPTFRRLMGHQVVAADTRVSVRRVCVLFADLSGSVAFYRRVGDAEAFAFVRDLHALLRRLVEEASGAVVKTIGDAVMASFHRTAPGVACALDMVAGHRAWVRERGTEEPPLLRVATHVGPALAVRGEADTLDLFGTTVNLAARLEGVAGPGECVWTDEVANAPGVPELLRERGLEPSSDEAEPKGIGERVRLHRVRPPEAAAGERPGHVAANAKAGTRAAQPEGDAETSTR